MIATHIGGELILMFAELEERVVRAFVACVWWGFFASDAARVAATWVWHIVEDSCTR